MKIRTLIVDDEPLARARVHSLLCKAPDFELVGECSDGIAAIAKIQSAQPDLVFLDIQMPGCDGLEVMAKLPADRRPAVVFTTAHERFAVDAFDHGAVDYLLKPFDQDRFCLALQRVQNFLKHGWGGSEPLTQSQNAMKVERIPVRVEGRLLFLKAEEIVRVQAMDNYVELHLSDESSLVVRETMTALEARLGTADFFRINRSAIVNLNQVKEIKPARSEDYTVVLRDGVELPLSRTLRGKLRGFIR